MWNTYDKNNIFAKILRNEIPSKKVYESETVLAFENINPVMKTHILVIPKKPNISFKDFVKENDSKTIGEFFKEVEKVAEKLNLSGYKVNFNVLPNGGQEIPHIHAHILSDFLSDGS